MAPQLGAAGRPIFVGAGEGASEGSAEGSAEEPFTGPLGHDQIFDARQGDVAKTQIATLVTLPQPVTVTGITAFVGNDDKLVRYAVYADWGGEPAQLIVATAAQKSAKSAQWLTIDLPDTRLDAGSYWLALSFENSKQQYAYSNLGGVTRACEHSAAKDGFLAQWGESTAVNNRRVSIFATISPQVGAESTDSIVGYDTASSTLRDHVEKQQIATSVTIPEDGVLLSITAYVGNKDKDVRYAVYADADGEPGSLLAETFAEESSKTMGWLTLSLPDTPVVAGPYWLSLALTDGNQAIAMDPGGGKTRYKSFDAGSKGYPSTWGTSDAATTERPSIYATYATNAQFGTSEQSSGRGFKVASEWRDAESRPIAPHLFQTGGDGAIDFQIVDQDVIPGEAFAVKATVVGAAIQTASNGYHRPVTMRLHVGDQIFEPFGGYLHPVAGNLNDIQEVTCNSNGSNPRSWIVPQTFPSGTVISVDGSSWMKNGAPASECVDTGWDQRMTASTLEMGPQIKVLRDGDPVPDIRGLYQQDSVATYVADYVDAASGRMRLDQNEIIYLFELGNNGNSSSADFQDLVVVLGLGSNPGDLVTNGSITTLCGAAMGDTAGTAGDVEGSAGVSSAESFDQWFRAVLGTNVAAAHSITLLDDGYGVYEYATNDFHPIDDQGFGNEGEDHNHYFTYEIKARFVYAQCGGQFFEFQGSDDAWLFVGGELAMDLGGVIPGTLQFVQMDRLGLIDGQQYELKFYYAQRQRSRTDFRMRTNIDMSSGSRVPVSAAYD